MLGIATIIGIYYIEDICEELDELEEIIKAPLFGIIPWLTDNCYKNAGLSASLMDIAYQKIITSFKIRCYKKGKKALGFSSLESKNKGSVISVNVAKQLASSGASVVLIDADFREGSVESELHLNTGRHSDLTDLLMNICNYTSKAKKLDTDDIIGKSLVKYNVNADKYPGLTDLLTDVRSYVSTDQRQDPDDIIAKSLIKIPGYPNLMIIPNKNRIDNPYEILTSDAFPILIEQLKKKFDFIIVDTPPMLAMPDSITISQYLDGLVVICERKRSRSGLRKLKKTCDDNYIELFGAIARDDSTVINMPKTLQTVPHQYATLERKLPYG